MGWKAQRTGRGQWQAEQVGAGAHNYVGLDVHITGVEQRYTRRALSIVTHEKVGIRVTGQDGNIIQRTG